jgi:hypothetical protein
VADAGITDEHIHIPDLPEGSLDSRTVRYIAANGGGTRLFQHVPGGIMIFLNC